MLDLAKIISRRNGLKLLSQKGHQSALQKYQYISHHLLPGRKWVLPPSPAEILSDMSVVCNTRENAVSICPVLLSRELRDCVCILRSTNAQNTNLNSITFPSVTLKWWYIIFKHILQNFLGISEIPMFSSILALGLFSFLKTKSIHIDH